MVCPLFVTNYKNISHIYIIQGRDFSSITLNVRSLKWSKSLFLNEKGMYDCYEWPSQLKKRSICITCTLIYPTFHCEKE